MFRWGEPLICRIAVCGQGQTYACYSDHPELWTLELVSAERGGAAPWHDVVLQVVVSHQGRFAGGFAGVAMVHQGMLSAGAALGSQGMG